MPTKDDFIVAWEGPCTEVAVAINRNRQCGWEWHPYSQDYVYVCTRLADHSDNALPDKGAGSRHCSGIEASWGSLATDYDTSDPQYNHPPKKREWTLEEVVGQAYRAIVPMLLEGLELHGEYFNVEESPASAYKLWKLTLPKEQSE